MGELGRLPQDRPSRTTASATRRSASRDYHEFVQTLAGDELAAAGRALHGVRRAVLPQRLPGQQPDPGLERPRLPRPLAGGDRASSTGRTTSPTSPGRLCPAPCEAACVLEIREGEAVTIKQIELAIINRAWDEGWVDAAAADARDRAVGRRDRRRAGRHGVRAAAAPRGPRGDGVRARRGRRRAGPLRRPGLQDREVDRRAARRSSSPTRASSSASASTSARTSTADELKRAVRRGRDRDRRARPARPAGAGPRARRRPLRDGLPLPAQPLRRPRGGPGDARRARAARRRRA